MTLPNQPPKGTSDWMPDEFAIRKYIFDTWRAVCTQFGYEEYLTPIVEGAEMYRAKSGEDVGGKELMTMVDQAGRELAIRPEMTPSVTRMVTRMYQDTPKPIRLFSIANFLRNEKPQRGRNREFWQLNFDVFGEESVQADIEVLQMAIEIMLAFTSPKDSFILYINNRKLIDEILNTYAKVSKNQRIEVVRILDKWEKLSAEDFAEKLDAIGLAQEQTRALQKFMKSKTADELVQNFNGIDQNAGFQEIRQIINSLDSLGYADWFSFQPNIIRGFDYYDGMVFEVFDKNPENNRAMFGGGRYNGLASIFGSESFPAVGCAPGDETTRLFLESWNLVPENLQAEKYYLPNIDEGSKDDVLQLAQRLRSEGKNVEVGLSTQRVGKALEYADSKNIPYVILYGEREQSDNKYVVKDMKTGEQKEQRI